MARVRGDGASGSRGRDHGARSPALGFAVIVFLVLANIAVRFDVAALASVAQAHPPGAAPSAARRVAADDVLGVSTGAPARNARPAALARPNPPPAGVPQKLPPILSNTAESREVYDIVGAVDVHERDFIPKAKSCSVQWCKGVDRRRLASVIYDGTKDSSDTTPKITRAELEKVHTGVRVKIDGYKWGSSELEFANDSIVELKSTPLEYVKCVKKNVAVGYAINLLPPFIQTFISSFERYHGPCDEAILFVDDMRLAVQLDRSKGNVKFLDRKKWATKVVGAHRLGTATQRVPVLEAWLKERWHRYHFVTHIDTRDVVFYSNMFLPLFRHNVTGLFSAGEALPFFTSQMNRQWVNKYSGIRVMSDYIATLHLHGRPLPVICSGLYGGTALALYDYFGGFAAAVAAANRASKETLGIDQGIHVYLQIFGLPLANFPHPIFLLDEGTGPMRHWYTRESSMLRDSLGRHVNCEMEPYAVVHQLDRYKWAWDDAFSDYALGKDTSQMVDCTGAANETDMFGPSAPRAEEALPLVPMSVRRAADRGSSYVRIAGSRGPGSASEAGIRVETQSSASLKSADSASYEPEGTRQVTAPERTWDPLYADAKDAATTHAATSQLYNTVCAAHNAVLLFSHIWDPEVLQTLVAAIQRYHTTCDTVVLFVPAQDSYEALAHSDATQVLFEGYRVPSALGDAEDAGAEDGLPFMTPTPPTLPPGLETTARRVTKPPSDERTRIEGRRKGPFHPALRRQGRRLALGVITRWLLRRGAAFQYVTVIEDAARLRVAVYDNLFAPLYRAHFRGVWHLPFVPSHRSSSQREREVFADLSAVSDGLGADCLVSDLESSQPQAEFWRRASNAALNVSVLSSVYGGATQAVADALQVHSRAADEMDAAAWRRGTSKQCSLDPHVLEALRAHLVPAHLMSDRSGFPHDIVVLDDLLGPHRHVLGNAVAGPEWVDRFGRPSRCDRARSPYALVVGFAGDGSGARAFETFRNQYRRRGERVRQTGFEAYFETHASGKSCHE